MNRLAGSDASQVAVALISEDETVGPQALDSSSYCGSTSVGSLLPVDVQIVVGEDSASYGTDADGFLLHAHLLNNLGNELMNHAVRTTRAVMHMVVVHQRRLLIYQILWCNDIVFHIFLPLTSYF